MIAVTPLKNPKAIENIRLIAVGNAGINLLDRIYLETGGDIDCVAINTDSTSLNASMATEKILIGEKAMRGLGAGGDPELARQAVEESHEKLVELVAETGGAVFLGGLGGGTAGEVLIELQKLAREKGMPAFHIVTLPFGFEGPRRLRQANDSLHLLRQRGALTAVFQNERLGESASASGPIGEAFAACDQVLELAIGSFLEVLKGKGPWETSATELFGLLADSNPCGATFFSTAVAKGGTRAHDVVPKVFKSPLAKSGLPVPEIQVVHIHLSSGTGLSLAEIRTTVDLIRRELEEETLIHLGVSTDRRDPQELAVTIFGSARKPLEKTPPAAQAPTTSVQRKEVPQTRQPPMQAQEAVPKAVQETVAETAPDQTPPVPDVHSPEPADPATPQASAPEAQDVPELTTSASADSETELSEIPSHGESDIDAGSGELLPGMDSVPSTPRAPARPIKKTTQKPRQEVLPLDVATRGRFERSEPTIEEGEDLDIPTFIRLKMRLK